MSTPQQKEFLINLMGIKYESRKMYRGAQIKIDLNAKRSAWLTDEEEEASKSKYGKYIYTFKTARPLKLINLSSWFFRFHFMDQLNIYYGGKENHNADLLREKLLTLIPVGLPTYYYQRENIDHYHVPKASSPCTFSETTQHGINKQLAKTAECFGGHRFSEKHLDKLMVDFLKRIYGDCFDGYIIPTEWPSCWHRFFPREICVFNQSSSLRFVKMTEIHVTGGRKKRTKKSMKDEENLGYKALFDKMTMEWDDTSSLIPIPPKRKLTDEEIDELFRKRGWVDVDP